MYYLGIDGGGTKTAFLLADEQQNGITHVTLGASNPVDVGFDTTLAILKEGIDKTLDDIPREQVSVFAGIAGCMTDENRSRVQAFLDEQGFACAACGGDVQNVVAAGLGSSDGICTIMGTGSVTFAQRDGGLTRLGGYGYLFDKGGSGYALGRDAIRACLAAEQEGGEPTLMREKLLERLQTPTVLAALGEFYQGGKAFIASFAPLVFVAYEQGDAIASRILQDNMACVADEVQKARRMLNDRTPVRFVLSGGLTARADVLLPLLRQQLDEQSAYDITILTSPPVMGAVTLAKENYHDQNRNEK